MPGGWSSSGAIVSSGVTTHILPGCSRQSLTARRESTSSAVNRSQARLIVPAVLKGLVGLRIEKASYCGRPSSAWRTQSMSGEREPASSAGRSQGASAP